MSAQNSGSEQQYQPLSQSEELEQLMQGTVEAFALWRRVRSTDSRRAQVAVAKLVVLRATDVELLERMMR